MRLPVSGLNTELRALTGFEDAMLVEGSEPDPVMAVQLLERIVQGGGTVRQLPVPDVEALLLELRRRLFGDRIRTSAKCSKPKCGAQIDIDFSIPEYMEHHRPRKARNAEPDPENPGWFRMSPSDARFRLPTVGDQLEAISKAQPLEFLVQRTTRPADVNGKERKRIEKAMTTLAPTLSSMLEGVCPECGTHLEMEFDVYSFVVKELRQQGMYLYEEVHTLATRYHWSEDAILAMPSSRRARYAGLASGAAGQERNSS